MVKLLIVSGESGVGSRESGTGSRGKESGVKGKESVERMDGLDGNVAASEGAIVGVHRDIAADIEHQIASVKVHTIGRGRLVCRFICCFHNKCSYLIEYVVLVE